MNPCKTVQQYIDDVLSGKILACREHKAAVQRHVDDLKRAKKKHSPIYFDQDLAEIAIEFMPLLSLTTSQWAGKPFIPEPWQMFVVWSLFGWRRSSDGTRRYREAYITVARGNGKCLAKYWTSMYPAPLHLTQIYAHCQSKGRTRRRTMP